MDLEDLREVISAYQTSVAETVRRFGGFVARYLGDGVLIYFGYPAAHEDDAERPHETRPLRGSVGAHRCRTRSRRRAMDKTLGSNSRRKCAVQCSQQSPLFGIKRRFALDGASGRISHAELGGHVRKGEGTRVYFVKQLEVRDDADEAPARLIAMMREYTVFNVDQCDGLPDSVTTGKPMRIRNPDARDDLADEFMHSTGADIREGHGAAFYVPSRDFISIPAFEAFKGADHFYNVAFHELTHWTAHRSRLDRDLKNRFGSRNYAAEELVAELGAAFLCAEFGFDGDLRHAAYVSHWIELLKADKRAFFTACSQASKAADYLRGLALVEPTEVAA
jgi:hypothetical protein